MFVRIGNTPRDYAWGSTSAIAELLGTEPSGSPEAELWLGAHPGSPSVVLDPDRTGGARNLAEWIALDPDVALGGAVGTGRLPYLLKVLAAAGPLSLQAHPSLEQAKAGFERENQAGIALDSPERNYKDAWHKPELIYALSDTFDALCGFRDPLATARTFAALSASAEGSDADAIGEFAEWLAAGADAAALLRDATAWLLGGDPKVAQLVDALVRVAAHLAASASAEIAQAPDLAQAVDTIGMLDVAFPADPGIALALLLNRVTVRRGEVLYLPAGNIHAYLWGLGIELMAASDNVLRGGLTPKRVDVPELLAVLDFSPLDVEPLTPLMPAPTTEVFRPDVPDFALAHIVVDAATGPADLELPGPAIALCTGGELDVTGANGVAHLVRGESLYVTPDERALTFEGAGTVFVALPNT